MYLVLQHFESRGPKTEEHKHPSKYNFAENLLIKGVCVPRASALGPHPRLLALSPSIFGPHLVGPRPRD